MIRKILPQFGGIFLFLIGGLQAQKEPAPILNALQRNISIDQLPAPTNVDFLYIDNTTSMDENRVRAIKKAVETWNKAVGKVFNIRVLTRHRFKSPLNMNFLEDEDMRIIEESDVIAWVESYSNITTWYEEKLKTDPKIILTDTIAFCANTVFIDNEKWIRYIKRSHIIFDAALNSVNGNKPPDDPKFCKWGTKEHYSITDPPFYDVESVALHELGHALGMPEDRDDTHSVMSPTGLYPNIKRTTLSAKDIVEFEGRYFNIISLVNKRKDKRIG